MPHLTLLVSSLQNSLLNAALHNQPVHSYLFSLAQPVCSIHCLCTNEEGREGGRGQGK